MDNKVNCFYCFIVKVSNIFIVWFKDHFLMRSLFLWVSDPKKWLLFSEMSNMQFNCFTIMPSKVRFQTVPTIFHYSLQIKHLECSNSDNKVKLFLTFHWEGFKSFETSQQFVHDSPIESSFFWVTGQASDSLFSEMPVMKYKSHKMIVSRVRLKDVPAIFHHRLQFKHL